MADDAGAPGPADDVCPKGGDVADMIEGGMVPRTGVEAGDGDGMRIEHEPRVETGMLIRRPVADVFEAFVDPAITTRFWFTRSSGRLEPGKQVRWEWEMYDVSAQVDVQDVEPNERILIAWGSADETPMTVEWVFTPLGDDMTFVNVTNWGFTGNGDEIARQAIDAMGGFTLVLVGAKALLEHGIELNLVPDRYPAGHVTATQGE